VVVVDTANNDAFTTTTTAGFTGGVGVAQETIANNATGRVLIGGYAALVNVNASVTRGQFGATHTVAKQAAGTAVRGTGTFCQFLTGGTTPDAIVYSVDLLGTSLTNPMTAKGDMIQGDTGGTPSRTAAGTSGQVWTSGGAAAFSSWQTPTSSAAVSDYTEDNNQTDVTAGPTAIVSRTVTLAAGTYVAICSWMQQTGTTGNGTVSFQKDSVDVDSTQRCDNTLDFVSMSRAFTSDGSSHTYRLQCTAGGGTNRFGVTSDVRFGRRMHLFRIGS
jgi:hypothetical protein